MDEGALGDLTLERHEAVGGEFEGRSAGGVQIDLVHKILPCVLSAYVDVAAVILVVEHVRVDLDDGKALSILSGFGGEDYGRRLDELP